MSLGGWSRSVRQAIGSVSQGGLMSLASVATIAITLLVLAVVVLIALNLGVWADSVESQVEIRVFLRGGVSAAQGQALATRAQQWPGVRQAEYVSKAEALRRMREQFKDQPQALAGLDQDNPLPDAIEIRLTDAAQANGVAAAVTRWPETEEIRYGKEMVERLLALTRAVNLAGTALVGLLAVATVLTVSNTIRLTVFARRREVGIMKLVGATDWFIRRPFVLEGIVLGVVGALVALAITGGGYRWLVTSARLTLPFLPLASPDLVISRLGAGLVALGALVGAIGSLLSLRRFLRV